VRLRGDCGSVVLANPLLLIALKNSKRARKSEGCSLEVSRGAVRLSAGALVVELRPSAVATYCLYKPQQPCYLRTVRHQVGCPGLDLYLRSVYWYLGLGTRRLVGRDSGLETFGHRATAITIK